MAPLSLTVNDPHLLTRMRTLPVAALRASAAVDFLQFFAGTKPALRSVLDTPVGADALGAWCRKAGYDFAIDSDYYFCVTQLAGQAEAILELDRQYEQHELEFGQVLGYPHCCCQQVAQLTEAGIDAYAATVARWQYVDDYHLINPTGYLEGNSLVSHLPCTPNCDASLALAKRTHGFLVMYAAELRRLLPNNQYLPPA